MTAVAPMRISMLCKGMPMRGETVEDDRGGAGLAGIAREQLLDGVVLVDQGKNRARGAGDHALVLFFLVHGADVERHAAGVLHGEPLYVLFGPDTAEKIILALRRTARGKRRRFRRSSR